MTRTPWLALLLLAACRTAPPSPNPPAARISVTVGTFHEWSEPSVATAAERAENRRRREASRRCPIHVSSVMRDEIIAELKRWDFVDYRDEDTFHLKSVGYDPGIAPGAREKHPLEAAREIGIRFAVRGGDEGYEVVDDGRMAVARVEVDLYDLNLLREELPSRLKAEARRPIPAGDPRPPEEVAKEAVLNALQGPLAEVRRRLEREAKALQTPR